MERAATRCRAGRDYWRKMLMKLQAAVLSLVMALAPLAGTAWGAPPSPTALPTGGQVAAGQASIATNGSRMDISQSSTRGVINWNSFNIGQQAWVNFTQPDAGSVTLNRVISSDPSGIFGRLSANGQVFLLNPSGILFGPSAQVNVGGMVASSLRLSDGDFLQGNYRFYRDGAAGSVVNQGSLSASDRGYLALLAPEVRNEGVISARLGSVALAAGDRITLDLTGDGLISLAVDPGTVDALVENSNLVQADGGQVFMSAQGAGALTSAVVNNEGIVRARGIGEKNGVIRLEGSGLVANSGTLDVSGAQGGSLSVRGDRMVNSGTLSADGDSQGGSIEERLDNGLVETASALVSARGGKGSITVQAGEGELFSSGSYRADGLLAGQTGGSVTLTGNRVALMGASVSASGDSGGGSILVGGDFQGKNAGVPNAGNTTVGSGVTLAADAVRQGSGGKVVVWSDQNTAFAGSISAQGGSQGGDGGVMEVSGKQDLHFAGFANGYAPQGSSGNLLLDPKNIYIDSNVTGQLEFLDPHPTAGGSFGASSTALTTTSGSSVTPTGYVVVTNPTDNLGAANGGAAYLFRQSDQALISTLYGSHANDQVGGLLSSSYSPVTTLTNGSFVLGIPTWNGGLGAATWGSGSTGWGSSPLAVSSANSTVGSLATDKVGDSGQVKVLPNGNYLVADPGWGNGKGEVTFGSGSSGAAGVVGSGNSLVGSTASTQVSGEYLQYKWGDQVGGNVQILPNGNYVVLDSSWNKGVGAVSFASGTTGISGVVSSSNSLVGTTTRSDATGNGSGTDKVGYSFQPLSGSKFLVSSSGWNVGSGEVTWFDGVTPVTGVVSSANSLVGGANDWLSSGGISLLPGNNAYVISSPSWGSGKGAVTWVPYASNVKDVTVSSSSLVGSSTGDLLSSKAVTVLADGDYVAVSPNWSSTKGAVTLMDGSTGKTKLGQSYSVSGADSIVGSQSGDQVGSNGVLELTGNGNFVALSPYWANGANSKAGAVTWSSGSTPVVGAVSGGNSLIGASANDLIGSEKYTYYNYGSTAPQLAEGSSVTLLSNGNYAVSSPMWNGTRGAVTWVNGATGATSSASNSISSGNSLVGSSVGDFVGGLGNPYDVVTNTTTLSTSHVDAIGNGVTALANGNFVVVSDFWKNGAASRAGAVTWSDGSGTPTLGAPSSSNSLVGSNTNDYVGLGKYGQNGVAPLLGGYDGSGAQLYSGNYLVTSASWKNGSIAGAGALTWGSGSSALTGTISNANSLLGLKTNDVRDNWNITPLYGTGNYLVANPNWDNGAVSQAGAATWVDGSTGRLSDYAARGSHNIVSASNSLVGTQAGDQVGYGIDYLFSGMDANWNYTYTGNYLVLSSLWNNGPLAAAGAVTWGSGVSGVSGTISASNSILGSKAGQGLGGYGSYTPLINGNYLVANSTWDNGSVSNAGYVSWIDGTTGRLSDYAASGNLNSVSAANSLVGTHTDDKVGSGLGLAAYQPPYSTSDTSYFVTSNGWNCNAGALTWVTDATHPFTGVVSAANSILGDPNGNFWTGAAAGNPITISPGGAANSWLAGFTGDNGHVVLLSQPLATQPGMSIAGATGFGNSASGNQAITPDYIAGILKSGTSLTLQANNDIYLKSGIDASGGTAGSSLTMQAGRSIAIMGDIVTGNRDLTMVANETAANGVSNANRDAGVATISMGADSFGHKATINAGSGNVSITLAAGADKTNKDAGTISLNSITAGSIKVVNNGNGNGASGLPDLSCATCSMDPGYRGTSADVVLNAGAALSASGAGSALTLAALGNFVNNSGNGAGSLSLSNGSARWLVYSNAPAADSFGGLSSGNTALWGRSYGSYPSVAETGNRYLFAGSDAVTLTTTSASKTYGATADLSGNYTLGLLAANRGSTYGGVFLDPAGADIWSSAPTLGSSGAAASAGVGSSAITASGAVANTGYSLAYVNSGTLTINKANLTVTANSTSKTFGSTLSFAGTEFSSSGLQNSQSIGSVTLSSTGAGAGASVAGGPYPILISGATGGSFSSANYNISYVNGVLTVNPAVLSIVTASIIGNPTKSYNGNNAATLASGNFSLLGFVGSDSATVTKTSGTYDSANAGARTVSVTLADSDFSPVGGTVLSNYTLPTVATGSGTISPLAVTLSAPQVTKTYDGGLLYTTTAGNLSALSGSLVGGNTVTAATIAYLDKNAGTGTKAVTLSNVTINDGNGGNNYAVTLAGNSSSTISKAHLTVTADNQSRLYGDANPALTGQISGFVGGEVLGSSGVTGSAALSSTATATTPVGSAPITAAAGTLAAGNYDFTSFTPGTLTIGKAHLSVVADNQSRLYGDANPTLTAQIGGFKNGENLGNSGVTGSAALNTAAVATTDVGSAPITVAAGSLAAGNYDFTGFTPATLTIGKAHLSVVADNQGRLYGDANPTLTAQLSGFKNGQNLGSSGVTGSAALNTSAVATTDVGSVPITVAAGSLAAGNYDFTGFTPGTLTIGKAHLSVVADNQGRLYGDANPTLTAQLSGFKNGENLGSSGVTGSAALNTIAVASTDVGSAPITVAAGSLAAGNYDFTGFTPGTLTIGKAHLSVVADNQGRLYGDANPTLTAQLSGFKNGENLGNSGVTGAAALNTIAVATTDVGTAPITVAAGSLAAGNYDFTGFTPGTLTIGKAHLSVVADNQGRLYGDANPTLTAQLSGFKNGQDLGSSGVTGAAALNTAAVATTDVGSAPITVAAGSLAAGNYDFTGFTPGTLTIGKAHLSVVADNQGRLYGDANPTLTAQISGFKNGQDLGSSGVTGSAALNTIAVATTDVGSVPITAALGSLAAGNYDFTGFTPGTLTIGKAHLSVVADNQGRLYGDANPTLTAQLSGFKNGENLGSSGVTGAAALNTAAVATTDVGSVPITVAAGSLAAGNYDFTGFTPGTLTIGKAHLSVVADNQGRLYGDANPTLTAQLSGFKNGQDLGSSGVTGSAALNTSAVATTDVGSAPIAAAAGTLAAGNYDFTSFTPGTLTIGKAHLSVVADNQSRLYGDANPTLTAQIGGFKNGENLGNSGVTGSAALNTAAVATTDVGSVPITVAAGSLAAGNYDFTGFTPATLTIGKAHLSVVADNQGRLYGDANPTLTAQLSGFKNGQDLGSSGVTGSAALNTSAVATTDVGSAPITAALGSLAAGNYDFTGFTPGTLTIGKAHLSVVADNQGRLYGDANPTLTAQLSGFKNGQDLGSSGVTGSAALNTAAVATTEVGSVPITVAAGSLAAGNYDFTGFTPGTLTIGKAHLSVVADNQGRLYGDANPTLTAQLSGFKNGENLGSSGVSGTPALSTTAVATTGVGGVPITAALGTLEAGNYDFTSYLPGTLTINKAPLTISADNKGKVYGDPDPLLTASYSGFKNNETAAVVGDLVLDTATGKAASAGTHAITASGANSANYAITMVDGTLTVTKAPLTVSADNKAKTYGDADPALTASFTGLRYDDLPTVVSGLTLSTATGKGATAGTHAIVSANGAADNYSISNENGVLTVGKANLTVTADDKSRLQGEVNPPLSYQFGSFKYDDSQADLALLPTAATTAVQSSLTDSYPITLSGGQAANYDFSYRSATLLVKPAPSLDVGNVVVMQTRSGSQPDSPAHSFGTAGTPGSATGTGSLITVNPAPMVGAPAATAPAAGTSAAPAAASGTSSAPVAATGSSTAGTLRLSVTGDNKGGMVVTEQGGGLSISVAPGKGGQAAATENSAPAKGNLTIYSSSGEGTKSEGTFAVNTSAGAVQLAPSGAPAAPAAAEGASTRATGAEGSPKSASFTLTTPEGATLEFKVNQNGNTLDIQPANEAAWKAVGSLDKKLITATGIMTGQDKLNLKVDQLQAVMIHEKQ